MNDQYHTASHLSWEWRGCMNRQNRLWIATVLVQISFHARKAWRDWPCSVLCAEAMGLSNTIVPGTRLASNAANRLLRRTPRNSCGPPSHSSRWNPLIFSPLGVQSSTLHTGNRNRLYSCKSSEDLPAGVSFACHQYLAMYHVEMVLNRGSWGEAHRWSKGWASLRLCAAPKASRALKAFGQSPIALPPVRCSAYRSKTSAEIPTWRPGNG